MVNNIHDTTKPLVSVIIATHNRCSLLRRAMESVLSQTYENLEVIVIDDASEDATLAVVDKYRHRFARFKYIRNDRPRDGARTRNIGIANAMGRYIAFLDDDDEWLPSKLGRQAQFLRAHLQVGAVSCWFIKAMGDREIKVKKYDDITFADMLWDNFLGSFSFVMVRREVFDNVGLIDEEITGVDDWDLWLRIARGYKLGVVKEYLAVYHWHSENISRWTPQMLERYAKVYERNKQFMAEGCKKYHIRRLIMNTSKLVEERKKRLKKFFELLDGYDMSFKTEFKFISYGFLALSFENSFLKNKISSIFQRPYYTELKTIYENSHKAI